MSEQHYIERYWRDATPQDAIKEPPMMARFRDNLESDEDWVIGELIYWDRSRTPWNSETCDRCERCQVYDVPDPGEGWRLIDPHKEPLQEGDEFMLFFDRKRGWIYIDTEVTDWSEKNFYRRRIEQLKPRYEPFRWEDREQLRGRWVQCVDVPYNEWMITTMYLGSRGELRVNSVDADRLRTGYVFADTGEPVGRKIQ